MSCGLRETETGLHAQLLNAGVRPTANRLCVLQALADATGQGLSGDEVFRRTLQKGASTSLGTVYRVLKSLHRAGLLQGSWEQGRGSIRIRHRYRFAMAQADTVQMRCGACNALLDIHNPDLHAQLMQVAQEHGLPWRGGAVAVQFEGRCAGCHGGPCAQAEAP
jgi:Fe2+ or Zn2+ uptake regulation protein